MKQLPIWQLKEKIFNELTSLELHQIYALRQRVFMIEQQVLDMDIDDFDLNAKHVYLTDGKSIVSYLRIIQKGHATYIGRVVTDQNYRRRGLAKQLVVHAIKQYDYLVLSAQIYAIPFYESCGFIKQGKTYFEAGLEHQKMIYSKSK